MSFLRSLYFPKQSVLSLPKLTCDNSKSSTFLLQTKHKIGTMNPRKEMEDGAATKGDSTSADKETNRPSREKEGGPSLNSLALVRKASTPADILSMDIKDWHCVVREGVLLNNDTQKFWVDAKLHKNCFLVLPKACDIGGGNVEGCWYWITMKLKCFHRDVYIRVPESKELSWLLIQGRFETRALSPNTMYEVAFLVKLNRIDSELPSIVNLELHLPDGTKQTGKETLRLKPREEWINLRAGKFVMGPKTVGTISFALQGRLYPQETGLILKGVLIHPKVQTKHDQFDAVEEEFS